MYEYDDAYLFLPLDAAAVCRTGEDDRPRSAHGRSLDHAPTRRFPEAALQAPVRAVDWQENNRSFFRRSNYSWAWA